MEPSFLLRENLLAAIAQPASQQEAAAITRYLQKSQYDHECRNSADVSITEEDLRYLGEKCLTFQLYRHLDLSDPYICADFFSLLDQQRYMDSVADFCYNQVAGFDRSGLLRKTAQHALRFLHASISAQQLRSLSEVKNKPDSSLEKLGQLLAIPHFLDGTYDEEMWQPWEMIFFPALIDIDPKLPTRFFSVLAQEQSRARFAKQNWQTYDGE